jgi:hypothetical protein
MRLTWRDGAATAVVAAAGGLYLWHLADPGMAVVGSARWAAAGVFVLGVVACAAGTDSLTEGSRYASVMSAGGGLAAVLTVFTLVTGSGVTLAGLIAVVGLLWLVTTARHLLGVHVRAPATTETQELSRRPG